MDLNSQPDTVWMCLREEGRLVEKSQIFFRRVLSDEEYVKLMGARTGEKIFIYPYDHPERCHTDCCVGTRRREKSRALRA